MDLIFDGLKQAVHLILTGDAAVLTAATRSLFVSVLAVLFASALGMPFGVFLARSQFTGQRILILFARSLMATPTVFIGLVCFALFSRQGPLGSWQWLFTVKAIVFGEFLLAFPIVTVLSHGAVQALDARSDETARALGATRFQRFCLDLSEARTGILLAVIAAFSRCLTELGVAMMVGGNIKRQTRTLTTAIAQETGQGQFARALAMGLILIALALLCTALAAALSEGLDHDSR